MARHATGIAAGVALVLGAGSPLAVGTASAAIAGSSHVAISTAHWGSPETSATAGRSRQAA
jgi:hypothetical protein